MLKMTEQARRKFEFVFSVFVVLAFLNIACSTARAQSSSGLSEETKTHIDDIERIQKKLGNSKCYHYYKTRAQIEKSISLAGNQQQQEKLAAERRGAMQDVEQEYDRYAARHGGDGTYWEEYEGNCEGVQGAPGVAPPPQPSVNCPTCG